jgi:hypothetical protein
MNKFKRVLYDFNTLISMGKLMFGDKKGIASAFPPRGRKSETDRTGWLFVSRKMSVYHGPVQGGYLVLVILVVNL